MNKKVFGWLGVALVSYAVISVIASRYMSIETTAQWWTQVIGSILGGGYLTVTNLTFPKLSLPNFMKPSVVNDDPMVSIPDKELCDEECLHHLAVRVKEANHEEGLKLLASLNVILFEIRYNVKK